MSVIGGVRLGIDVGRARIGVARCDLHGMLATPVETVPRAKNAKGELSPGTDVARILAIVSEEGARGLIIGLPLNMRGESTASTDDARDFAQLLADRAPHLEVRLVDERLSTVSAQSQLRSVGKKTKESRGVIDQAAAVVILQHALEIERVQGVPAGSLLAPNDGTEAGA
ncbi:MULTISPECIES: Holliday junction resolvase RuvX [unclassified Leucobacter]|uniref:Holliday junction resolvase RuvX n=1 Tax=unclassified Leucobacter TaxID=2621730 RepID=UPI00165D532B|nr:MULTISPECIES: Holliday junction resolvase RuvX [unclassified Leucobacter]MBC9926839.1 Holliday junction resolvase RuvX [Leucobacter sp. cx-169]MBC9935199.1 Holliday junction resolvase RuvX [Leucobacter sp. cx-87]